MSTEPTPAAPPPAEPSSARAADDRLGTLIAVGLATVGLLGALIAWRVVGLGGDAGGAGREAIAAARQRAAATLAAEAKVSDAHAAWLAYELERRLASGLRAEGHTEEALPADKNAAAHWGFTEPQYVGSDGEYRVDEHRAGAMARVGSTIDIEPAPHLDAAAVAEQRSLALGFVALLVAAALPFLTLAEVAGPGRVRAIAAAVGGLLLGSGIIAVVLQWA